MEYAGQLAGALVFLIVSVFFIRRLVKMEDKLTDLELRTSVAEAKATAHEHDNSEIKELIKQVLAELSDIKQEQGYWRGRQENRQ